MRKKILFSDEAKTSIQKGIDKLYRAVSMTLGPRGRAMVIQSPYGTPQVTFDGVTVARELSLEDDWENLGADFLKQAADKTNDKVGDGTTTATIIAYALMTGADELTNSVGFNVIKFADELNKMVPTVLKALEAQKEDIKDPQKLREVAILSSKDKDLGELIATVMEKVGEDGVVTVEGSQTIENSYELVDGLRFDKGLLSPYMVTDVEKVEAKATNIPILITDKKISLASELFPILEKIKGSGKGELLLIADDVDGEALQLVIANIVKGAFRTYVVKAPGFGERKKELLKDIAIVTGANVVSDDIGKKLESASLDDLGGADSVIVTRDTTTIVGGRGSKGEIDIRIKQIRSVLKDADGDYEKDFLKQRLAKLVGGVAVIKIGAPTESAQKEILQRVDDAVNATKAAMEEGIVPGGGMALLNVAKDMDESEDAAKVMRRALLSPIWTIINNSGQDPAQIVAELKNAKPWHGFDGLTGQIENLKEKGIVDPLKVTKTAFINAVSVATNYLVIGGAMVDAPKKNEEEARGI